jgi:acyl-CoA thioester hydrolase
MGYCYYGNYAQFYEVGRVESLRSLGFPYKSLEEQGVLLPVTDFTIKYLSPAYYDDLLTIHTIIKELPGVRIKFDYEIFNESGEKLNFGATTLVFVNKVSGKPIKCPEELSKQLKEYI